MALLNLKGQFINKDLLIPEAVYEFIHICSDLLFVIALASEDAIARGRYKMWAQKLLIQHCRRQEGIMVAQGISRAGWLNHISAAVSGRTITKTLCLAPSLFHAFGKNKKTDQHLPRAKSWLLGNLECDHILHPDLEGVKSQTSGTPHIIEYTFLKVNASFQKSVSVCSWDQLGKDAANLWVI